MRAAIVSVKYGDLLAVTLPAWKKLLPDGVLTVATSPEDTESQEVAAANGVPCFVTDAWTRRDPEWTGTWGMNRPVTFNCALGLDESLGLIGSAKRPAIGEVIAAIHVDCWPQGKWCPTDDLRDDTLYGVWRHFCPTPEVFEQIKRGKVTKESVPRMKNSGGRPVGYFQMFRYRDGERFGSYPTAQKYDTHFCAKWKNLAYVYDFWLWHLGPHDDANWAGRVVPRWHAA